MLPFPNPLPDPIFPDPDLQAAFDAAIAATPLPAVPITIVALNGIGASPHGSAGQMGGQMHYSASLLKVAAMYAAFELRKAANVLLQERNPPPADVFALLESEFNQPILNNLVRQLNGVAPRFLLPSYRQIFEVLTPPSGVQVNFNSIFFGNLHDAIARSINTGAGQCIQALGYGYLTGALAAAGFFDEGSDKGIWLCGDFSQGWPKVTISSSNDADVAQAMSTDMMARLYAHVFDKRLVDEPSSDGMQGLLAATVKNGHFFLSRARSLGFATFSTKIGDGPLKTGKMVASEGSILRDVGSGKDFIAVWQNQAHLGDASIEPISRVVDKTIRAFVS